MNRYIGPIKWLGGIAIVLFIFSFVFGNIIMPGLPEATRNSVLTHAVPFFAAFVGVLLLFILVIVLVALRFNGKIPDRTYANIEKLIVAGILFGVVCLFNPWSFVPYRYGFGLLLISTLAFILWSHIAPPRANLDDTLLPITPTGHIVGLVIGGRSGHWCSNYGAGHRQCHHHQSTRFTVWNSRAGVEFLYRRTPGRNCQCCYRGL